MGSIIFVLKFCDIFYVRSSMLKIVASDHFNKNNFEISKIKLNL